MHIAKMSDTDEDLFDKHEEINENHSKLLKAVTQLDKKQRIKKAERSEPSLEISEYHLAKSEVNKDAIGTRDLIKLLEQKGDQSNIIRKLQYIQKKNKVIPKPLEKLAAERIKRTVGYEKIKEDLQKWDSVVTRNRTAEQLIFPLKNPTTIKDSSTSKIPEFLRGFSIKSDLMKKIEMVSKLPSDEEGEKDNYKMTLEEIILKRKEAARLRAQQSYREAKAHRQSKIKSKKFHRIQRKNKIKQQVKDFEKLKDSNPKEALAMLEQLDKTRAEERMSLRHKNTGQWAKNKQIKAKYNKETRQILAEQLAISKELTQKIKRTDSDEEDEDMQEYMEKIEDEEDEITLQKENNIKTESEITDFIKLCRGYYDKKQNTKEKAKKDKILETKNREEEIKELCNDEENNIVNTNKNNENSKSSNKKSSTLQTNSSKIKKKLHGNKKNNNSDVVTDKTKSKSCNNENNTDLLANINNSKDKVLKRKKNKEKSDVDVTSKHDNKKLKSENKAIDSKDSKKRKSKLNSKVEKTKKKHKSNKMEKKKENSVEESENYSPNLEFENPKRKPILDSPLEETVSKKNTQKNNDRINLKAIANATVQKHANTDCEVEIDPKKYVNIKPKYLRTELPDITTAGDEDNEQEEEAHKIMSEAFADDDVVDEFRREKEEEMKKSQPQEIDLSLPGWGNWGGPNIKRNKVARKKSRFILTVPKVPPRKPENQGKVIVYEHDNENLRKHLVKELPYPFTKVKDFEASIRAPVSRTFVPMNAHLQLIRPSVKTKLGQIIEPMNENELVKKPIVKKPLKRIAKTKKNVSSKNK